MVKARRGSRRGAQAWLDEATDVPRAGLPDEKWSKRARWHRRYVKFSAYAVLPVLLLAVFAVFGRPMAPAGGGGDQVVAGVDDAATIDARAVAKLEVRGWLSGEASPLPDGRIVSWNYARPVTAMSDQTGDDTAGAEGSGDRDILVHDFTVTASSRLFSVEVSTLTDPDLGTVVVGTPSLMPRVPAAENLTASTPWPGAVEAQLPEVLPDVVASWAEAFTSGDPDKLRLATGDPDGSHSYMPLSRVSLVGSDVTAVAVPKDQLTDQGKAPDNPSSLVVRVSLALQWGSGPAEGQESGQEQVPESSRVTYDLLLTGTDTASPRVVAWGGPGSGPGLTPYANAVTGRSLTGSQDQSEGASPEPSEGPDAQDESEKADQSQDAKNKEGQDK